MLGFGKSKKLKNILQQIESGIVLNAPKSNLRTGLDNWEIEA